MKQKSSRYAFLGLILSALSVIVFLSLLIVRGLLKANILQLPDPQILDKGNWLCLAVFVLGFSATALLDPEGTRRFIFGRQAQYGSNAILMLAAFMGILFLLNLLAFQNPKSWDLTQSGKNSLSPETISLLKVLPHPVIARAYFSPRTDSTQANILLENFKQQSANNLEYQFIDPETNPVAAQNDGVQQDGTIILSMEQQKEPVSFIDEEQIDSALIRLINPQSRVIYFSTGHGEADIEQADDASYSSLKIGLENKNYMVKTINLGTKIPDDAKTIVIAGPQIPFTDNEVINLQLYLDKGAAVIFLEDPNSLTKIGTAPNPLDALINKWGIILQNDVIYDPTANPPLLAYADSLNYGQHPISTNLRGVNTRFFTAQSIITIEENGVTLSPLVQTYADAWGESDNSSIEKNQVTFDPITDKQGPLVLAVAGENAKTKARIVVFGDSDFSSNALYKLGYGTILLNSIDWTTGQEKLINLTAKNNTVRTYNPPGNTGLIGIILTSLCFIPLLIIAGGVSTWYTRRKRG